MQLNVPDTEIVVVDNHSVDNSVDLLQNLVKKIKFTLLLSKKNNGFAAGNNIGIRYACGNNFTNVIILNNDLVVESDVFTPMIEYLDKHEEVAIVGPSLWKNGRLNNIGNMIDYRRVTNNNAISISSRREIMDVDFLIGACMVVKVSAIKVVGLMPEVYFLNYEETEWCLKFKRAGFKIQCLTKEKVDHDGGGTIGKYNGMQVYFLRRNIVLFEKRNASKGDQFIFFLKLVPLMIIQCLHHFSLEPMDSYRDGITGENRYQQFDE